MLFLPKQAPAPRTWVLPEEDDGWETIQDAQHAAATYALYKVVKVMHVSCRTTWHAGKVSGRHACLSCPVCHAAGCCMQFATHKDVLFRCRLALSCAASKAVQHRVTLVLCICPAQAVQGDQERLGTWRQLDQPWADMWLAWEAREGETGAAAGSTQAGEAERLAFVQALVSQVASRSSCATPCHGHCRRACCCAMTEEQATLSGGRSRGVAARCRCHAWDHVLHAENLSVRIALIQNGGGGAPSKPRAAQPETEQAGRPEQEDAPSAQPHVPPSLTPAQVQLLASSASAFAELHRTGTMRLGCCAYCRQDTHARQFLLRGS